MMTGRWFACGAARKVNGRCSARERLRGGLIGRPLAYARGSGIGVSMLLVLIQSM
jgi:hypothetical protein